MKKGTLPMTVVVIGIVLMVTTLLVIFAAVRWLQEGGSAVSDVIEENAPGELPTSERSFNIKQPPKEVKDAYESLIKALNTKTTGSCIAEYGAKDNKGGLPDMKSFTIQFMKQDTGWWIYLINPDTMPVAYQEIGNELCVVGGEIYESDVYLADTPVFHIAGTDNKGEVTEAGQFQKYDIESMRFLEAFNYNQKEKKDLRIAAKNFYTNWIAEIPAPKTDDVRKVNEGTPSIRFLDSYGYASLRGAGKRIVAPDYTNPRYIEIKDKKNMVMRYYNSGADIQLGKEDGGLLYVPEKGKVCVFATFGGLFSNYNENGIHYKTLKTNKIPSCT